MNQNHQHEVRIEYSVTVPTAAVTASAVVFVAATL